MGATNIFLTGQRRIGKTTALDRYLKAAALELSGFRSRWFATDDGGMALHLVSLRDGTRGAAAAVRRTGRPAVALEVFNTRGAALARDVSRSDVVIMDELGFLESAAEEFKQAVFETLDSDVPVLGVLRQDTTPFLDAVAARADVHIITVTGENRDEVPLLIKKLMENNE